MKTPLKRLFAGFLLILFTSAVGATPTVRLGYVNTQRITTESKPAKAAQARLEWEFKGHEKEAGFKEKLDKRRNEELQNVLNLANQAVKQVAVSGGYNFILQEVVYVEGALDITDKVIEILNSTKDR